MVALELLTSKGGIIAIAIALLLATGLYFKAKEATVKALHTIEVSGLNSDLSKAKLDAQNMKFRNNACEFDLKFSLGKLAIQNDAVARMADESERRAAESKKKALEELRTQEDISATAEAGASGPVAMDAFVLTTIGGRVP